jgi:hypothetical protein
VEAARQRVSTRITPGTAPPAESMYVCMWYFSAPAKLLVIQFIGHQPVSVTGQRRLGGMGVCVSAAQSRGRLTARGLTFSRLGRFVRLPSPARETRPTKER